MGLSLRESRAIADIAQLLYTFLPGSGRVTWKGHVSFHSVAQKVGVGDFWQPGSKLPMITALLERTLQHRRHLFEGLILEIVRAGITYRQKSADPITREEIEQLNGLLLEVEFKFPDLWDAAFLESLRDGGTRAKEQVEKALKEQELKATEQSRRSKELNQLKERFFALHNYTDRQAAGRALQTILNKLFALSNLAPRQPFRVVGEEIDGSFELDYETYLLEAKWEKRPLPEADLLVFRGKIEGKSRYTRGVLIAINDVSEPAKHAITQGKTPFFFVINGYDLGMLLSEDIELVDFLRQRRRLLTEEGLIFVPYKELLSRSRTTR